MDQVTVMPEATEFDRFCEELTPRLRRAFLATVGSDRANDAVAEALAYAWERWPLEHVSDAGAYLFRVGISRTSRRRWNRAVVLPTPTVASGLDFEPRLVPLLRQLPVQQRTAVWLVCGCGWTHAETAIAMDVAVTTVGTHLARGLTRLRRELGVDE